MAVALLGPADTPSHPDMHTPGHPKQHQDHSWTSPPAQPKRTIQKPQQENVLCLNKPARLSVCLGLAPWHFLLSKTNHKDSTQKFRRREEPQTLLRSKQQKCT